MLLTNPQLKIIGFREYDRFFKALLESTELQQQRIMFFKEDKEGISISFSWDMFIIITHISHQEIHEMYKDDDLETIEVTGPEGVGAEHPAIKKFKAEYLPRAIPEE